MHSFFLRRIRDKKKKIYNVEISVQVPKQKLKKHINSYYVGLLARHEPTQKLNKQRYSYYVRLLAGHEPTQKLKKHRD